MRASIRISSRHDLARQDYLSLARRNGNQVLAGLLLIAFGLHGTAASVFAAGRVVPSQCMIVGDYHARVAAEKEAVRNDLRRTMRQAGMVAQNSQMQIGKLSEQLQVALSEQKRKLSQKNEYEEELREARHVLSEMKNNLMAAGENLSSQQLTASMKESEEYQEALKLVREAQDRLDHAESDLKRTSLAVVSLKKGIARNQQVLKISRAHFAQARARMP